MIELEDILNMIAMVSPDDIDELNKIDIHVGFFVNHPLFDGLKRNYKNEPKPYEEAFQHAYNHGYYNNSTNFTRSRDALKNIRPKENWQFSINNKIPLRNKWAAHAFNGCYPNHVGYVAEFELPTEELAELFCVLQMINIERKFK